MLTCLLALMITCSYVIMLWCSHASMLTCFNDHMLPCLHALMITRPLAFIPSCLTLGHFADYLLLCSNAMMIACSYALIFTCLISTHMCTQFDDEMSIGLKAKCIDNCAWMQRKFGELRCVLRYLYTQKSNAFMLS